MSPSSDVLVERTARLPEEVALHARPAGWLVRAAAAFAADVHVSANGRRADAGTELAIDASGEDAVAAAEHLVLLIPELT